MKKIVIFTGVYNEAPYIARTIESVLGQSFTNFDFIISDNHSTDGSSEIIKSYAAVDPRIQVISPPSFMTSLDHGRFQMEYLRSKKYFASLYIGGHDTISSDYAELLLRCLESNDKCIVAYPKEAFEVDGAGRILKRWGSSPQTVDVPHPFRTILTLIGLVHNIPNYGLWRYDLIEKGARLPKVTGGDHFTMAEATLMGDLIEVDGPKLYLRQARGANDLKVYQQKHIGEAINGVEDFMMQLKLLSELVDYACMGQPQTSQDFMRAASIALYIYRYNNNIPDVADRNQFFSHPDIQALMTAMVQTGARMKQFLKGVSAAPGAEAKI